MFAPRDVRSYVYLFPMRFGGKPEAAAHSLLGCVFYNATHPWRLRLVGLVGTPTTQPQERQNEC